MAHKGWTEKKVPERQMIGRDSSGEVAGGVTTYDDHFEMTVTLFGKPHHRAFTGKLADYAGLIGQLPEKLAILERVARELGETQEAQRFAALSRALPQMPVEQQAIKTLELVIFLDVMEDRLRNMF